jgi:sn-glycerol 3-phosphate transport system ATP-binding protein
MGSVSIRGVHKSFGRSEVVRGVDLEIEDGEFIVVLGPSGCGKSTLLRLIAGLESITSGEIAIGGKVVNALEPRERGCAMVFQNYALYPHMTVADNIGYALKVSGMPRAERKARIAKVADTLGLAAFLDRRPADLSGGQRQRVAMGRAIIREPSAFLFDEPLSNLDAKLRVQMRVEIRRLHRRLKATSIFVTHDQVEAMTLADRLVVMNQGRVEQVGSPAEVYRQPATSFVAGFIGSPPMNFLPVQVSAAGLIELGDGSRLPLEALKGRRPRDGRLTLGIRPEDVRLHALSSGGTVPISIEMVEELGAGRLLYGSLAGSDFVVALPAGAQIPESQRVFVQFSRENVHLFDPVTGERIGDACDFGAQAGENPEAA